MSFPTAASGGYIPNTNTSNPQVSVNVGGSSGNFFMTPDEQRQYDEYQEFLNSTFYTQIKEARDELVIQEKKAFLNWKDSLNPQSVKIDELTELVKQQAKENAEFKEIIESLLLNNPAKGGTDA